MRSVLNTLLSFLFFLIFIACQTIEQRGILNSELVQGENNYKEGFYTGALANYKKVLKDDPNNLKAYDKIGRIYIKLGHYKEAIISLKKRLKIKSRCFSCYVSLGEAYRALGKNKKAKLFYTKALKLRPSSTIALRNLSWCLFKLEEYDKGFAIVDSLYKKKKFDSDIAIIRIRYLLKLRKHKEVLSSSDYALSRIQTTDMKALFYSFKGDAYSSLFEMEKAKRFYQKAIFIQPLLGSALLGLGRYHFHRGDEELSKTYLTRALRVSRDLAEGYYLLARLYEGTESDKAKIFYAKFHQKAQGSKEYLSLIAEVQKRVKILEREGTGAL